LTFVLCCSIKDGIIPILQRHIENHSFENMLTVKDKIFSFTQSHNSGTIIVSDISVNQKGYLLVFEALVFQRKNVFRKCGYTIIYVQTKWNRYFLRSVQWCFTPNVELEAVILRNVPPSFVSNALHPKTPMPRLSAFPHIGLTSQTLLALHFLSWPA